jgi:hypothetical protein
MWGVVNWVAPLSGWVIACTVAPHGVTLGCLLFVAVFWAGTSVTVMGQVGAMGVAPEGPCSPLVCWGAAAGSSWGA